MHRPHNHLGETGTYDEFKLESLAGQTATLHINDRDDHCLVTWGNLVISDTFGDIGFWTSFHKTEGSLAKGSARKVALKKNAQQMIEAEIYELLKVMKSALAAAQVQ